MKFQAFLPPAWGDTQEEYEHEDIAWLLFLSL